MYNTSPANIRLSYTVGFSFNPLVKTIIVFILLLGIGIQKVFKQQDLQMFCLKLSIHFHPLDVVGRGSETLHQVGENRINYLI